jgi:hypothetical protein
MAPFHLVFRNSSQEAVMEHIPDRYDYSHLVSSTASESDKEFDVVRFDELLTDDDRKLLRCDLKISWWVYSDLKMSRLFAKNAGHCQAIPSGLSHDAIYDDVR